MTVKELREHWAKTPAIPYSAQEMQEMREAKWREAPEMVLTPSDPTEPLHPPVTSTKLPRY